TFSTLHSSKGLEFERVYMIDLVRGIIPSDHESDDLSLEEANRLFYVGMTRAKKRLELLSYEQMNGEAAGESPFVTAVRKINQAIEQQNAGATMNSNAIQKKKQLTDQKR